MKIRLPKHFVDRLKLRDIPDDLAKRILREADNHYRNGVTGWNVAVKRLYFQGKERDMALTYTIANDEIVLITLHPLGKNQASRRVESGRWRPYEPESLL